jgi:Flp pilus assembly protein TadD
MRIAWMLALMLIAPRVRADDWALTRPKAPIPSWQGELAAARALALEGHHAEAAAAFVALSKKVPGLRREGARELLAAGQPEAALELLGAQDDELAREAARRLGRGAELAARDERAARWASAGREWERVGDDLRALAAYEHARDDPARLRLLQKLGRTLEVEQLAQAMVKRAPGDPAPLVALAELRRAAGQREQALELLSRARSPAPALHRALHALYVKWGESALAERELTRLVELEPAEPAHRLALADALLARGDRERARTEVLRAAALDGSAAREAHAAELLADRDLLADALEHVALARKRAPNAYLELEASLLERAGRLVDAERVYKQLLAGERAPEARRRLAGLWRRGGTLDAHIAELRTRDDLASLRMLAELYARDPQKSDPQRALLRRILAQVPDDPDALRALARAHREAGDLHAAIALAHALDLEEALELARAAPRDPGVPALLQGLAGQPSARVAAELAAIYGLRGDLQEARAAYRRALALEPGADEVRLAWAELEQGPEAEAQLRSLLAQGHSEAVLLRAAARLGREPARAALLSAVDRRAQRRVLLALGEPLPIAALRSALVEGDERERARALAQVRPDPALTAALSALAVRVDRSLDERAAALRALPSSAQRSLYPGLPRALRAEVLLRLSADPAARALLERERSAHDPAIRAAAERALASDDALAPALFSPRAAERAAAAEALRDRDAWDAITRAAQANPAQLVPFGPGVVPSALIEAGMCPAREQVVAFSAALIPVLEDVALLVHAGGAHAETLRGLSNRQLDVLLRELAGRTELPPGAAEALRAERPRRDWPERMWATRALGQADARETMELVGSSAEPYTRAGTCAAQRTAN